MHTQLFRLYNIDWWVFGGVGNCQLEELRFHIYFKAKIAKFRQRNDEISPRAFTVMRSNVFLALNTVEIIFSKQEATLSGVQSSIVKPKPK